MLSTVGDTVKKLTKNIIIYILGFITALGIGVYVAVAYSADKITYKDTTVDVALTDLYKKVDTSSADIYVDNVKAGTAEANYHGSVMNNYEFTVEENQTSSIYVNINSNGAANGSRSIMVVVLKES